MSDPRIELALRRGDLRARCARQRDDLAEQSWPVERLLTGVDRVTAAGSWVRDHPKPVLGFLAGLLVLRPRRAWRWAKRGFFLWRSWSAIRKKFGSL